MIRVEVILPTFHRPEQLARCLRALREQTVEPDAVLVVAPRDDAAARETVAAQGWPALRVVDVDRASVVAALSAGVAASSADVLAFTDDDAAPRPDWLERLLAALAEPGVVGAGGRDVIPGETEPRQTDVGRVTRWGKLVGGHHLGTGGAREVDVLKGVNMAFRAERLALPVPRLLRGAGAEVHFEVLVSEFARRRGRIVYDPGIEVAHDRAERSGVGRPGRPKPAAVRDAAHNLLVGTCALERRRLVRHAPYCFLLGSRATPGLGRALLGLARAEAEVVRRLVPSLTGFALGLRRLGALPKPVMVEARTLRGKRPLRPLLLGLGWHPDEPGGLNRYLRDLLRALEQAGAESRAVLVGPAADAPSTVDVASARDEPLLRRLLAYTRLAVDRARDADLVDAHFALYAVAPLLLRRFRGRPLVVHFHGPWADESLTAGSRRLAAAVRRRVERTVYRRADRVITLTAAFKRLLVERYRVPPWDIEVIPPGVDLERFSPGERRVARAALGLPPDVRVVAAVRRLVPRMGIHVLLEAWRSLGAPGLLVVAGEGPSRRGLEAAAGHGVRFLGRIDDDELVQLYRAADVTVLPSLALEGFGLAALESLACGTPVVVTDTGGLPEAVRGLDVVVPAGDARALAARLVGTVPSPAECRAHAERFPWQEAATKTLSVYRRSARDTRIRVVYVDHTAALSGGELALLRLLPALAGDVEAHVVLAEDGPLAQRLAELGVSVEVLPLGENVRSLPRSRLGPAAVPASAAYTLRLARRLRALRPDLVHTNSLKAALYGGAAGRLARVPVVWHARDRIAGDYLPERAVRLVRAAARTLPAAVIANSRSTLETLGELRCRVAVIPSAVAPMTANGDRTGPFVAGMVGRIAPWKGQHVFLDAFARAFPDGEERAVVVGAPLFAEDAYFDELRASAAALDGRVELTGFRHDVGAELAHVDALVHASVVPEPFGQVLVEAMAAGLPVVAPRAGGPLELVEDGVDGLLYEPGDAAALAEHLRQLAVDANLRRRLGEAGRKKSERFAPEAIAREVVHVYRAVLS